MPYRRESAPHQTLAHADERDYLTSDQCARHSVALEAATDTPVAKALRVRPTRFIDVRRRTT